MNGPYDMETRHPILDSCHFFIEFWLGLLLNVTLDLRCVLQHWNRSSDTKWHNMPIE